MSAFNTGTKPCGHLDGENGCLCPNCVYFRMKWWDVPDGCAPHACVSCDPDRTEPDDVNGYGPTRKCEHFVPLLSSNKNMQQ